MMLLLLLLLLLLLDLIFVSVLPRNKMYVVERKGRHEKTNLLKLVLLFIKLKKTKFN